LKTKTLLQSGYQEINFEIIELSKAGDLKAQFRLYSLYSRAMFNICMRMVNHREEAEDLLQDSFTLAFSRLESFRYDSGFGTWLKRIVINRCINHLEKKKPEIIFEPELIDVVADEENNDFEEIKLKVDEVRKAIERLPDGYRIIFSLYALEGYDHEEISGILGISESTSKTQYLRAKNKIKELLIKSK
jgi:RNA polymerase sigma factor (sigma-70 family)